LLLVNSALTKVLWPKCLSEESNFVIILFLFPSNFMFKPMHLIMYHILLITVTDGINKLAGLKKNI